MRVGVLVLVLCACSLARAQEEQASRVEADETPAVHTILVAYYSRSGHTETMARAVARGASSVKGVEPLLRKVGDVTDEEILAARGLLVGTPVHWGSASAEARAFVNRVGNVLQEANVLTRDGRTAGVFCTGGAEASGKEMARMSLIAAFLNQRYLVIGGIDEGGFGTLGAQATTAPPSEGLSAIELEQARLTGERFARLTRQYQASMEGR